MHKRKPQHQEETTDAWLMSYADMITLLMCFFIIFVAVSEPKKERLAEFAGGISGKFGAVDYTNPFLGVLRALQATVENKNLLKDVAVETNENGVTVELGVQRFFKPGSAELDEEQLPALNEMLTNLKTIDFMDYTISIEAHTSNEAPASGFYPSNWELSAAQSARLARLFAEQGFAPKSIIATGHGDSRPKVPNFDAKDNPIPENQNKNQRVLIVLKRL